MSMTPKARKFRIGRTAAGATARPAAAGGNTAEEMLFADDDDDGFGDASFSAAERPRSTAVARPAVAEVKLNKGLSAEAEIAQIRAEGLTGRQLRMARRVALKYGLTPNSDFDAIRLLRHQGIDPFQRANTLELVPNDRGTETGTDVLVPPSKPQPQLPSTEVKAEDERAREIVRMQRDIVKRRRRKLAQLAARLMFFVLLPTLLVGWYYYQIATPMYQTRSEFVIQQAQPTAGGGASGLAGLFSGTSFATSQDSIAVQGYLQSIDAMLRLDEDMGFVEHFAAPDIDPLQRLDLDASKEEAYKLYQKTVKIAYDPTEGIIKMDVRAADPETSRLFSERLIRYAEEQVDTLSLRLRNDQMQGALESYQGAEAAMVAAQERVLELQEKLGVLDPITEQQGLMTQITTLETQLSDKRLQLQQLLDNARPNQARVDGARGDVERLELLIAELRAQMTVTSDTGQSLARVSGELRLAERDLQTRELMMTQALQQMETARIEANRQTRYLSMSVNPIAPDTAAFPRAFENTILAFLIFGGIYLMISLTASILREQVSS